MNPSFTAIHLMHCTLLGSSRLRQNRRRGRSFTVAALVCGLIVNQSNCLLQPRSSSILRSSSIMAQIFSSSGTGASVFEADKRFKEILLVRHGITEMNEKLAETPWNSRGFTDVGLWDTRLSQRGTVEALDIHRKLIQDGYKGFDFTRVQTLYASPLTRALQTAELLFAGSDSSVLPADIPKVAHPLLRERVYMSSDIGRSRVELHREFPEWNFNALPFGEEPWWYHYDADDASAQYEEWRPPGKYCVEGEPTAEFRSRMLQLRHWLVHETPETDCIAIVTHWGVIRALTGLDFRNCDMILVSAAKLLQEPMIDEM